MVFLFKSVNKNLKSHLKNAAYCKIKNVSAHHAGISPTLLPWMPIYLSVKPVEDSETKTGTLGPDIIQVIQTSDKYIF